MTTYQFRGCSPKIERGRGAKLGIVGKLYKNAIFLDFLVIIEGKGGCYMPEICIKTGSGIVGDNRKHCP